MLHREITQNVINAAHGVHEDLGQGFSADIYTAALGVEFAALGVDCQRNLEQAIVFREETVGHVTIPLLVQDVVVVYVVEESSIPRTAYAQTRSLMTAADSPLGMILGFGGKRLDVSRVEETSREDSEQDDNE